MANNTDTGDPNDRGNPNTVAQNGGNSFGQDPAIPPPREALIATAVNFLHNPNVRRSPIPQKQKFLRSKGLTEEEIQIACDRAGVFSTDPTNGTVINMGFSATSSGSGGGAAPYPGNHLAVQSSPQTALGRIKEVLNSIALISGLAYAIYLFYKKFIEPWLFGKKKKTLEENLQEMDKKLDQRITDVQTEISRVREEVTRNYSIESINRELGNFKSDLDAIKGLLLNRKQFAPPLPLHTPLIPEWQLNSHRHSETEQDKNDDAGSGSGSSETEVVTKNSDSSLEIM